MCNSSARDCRVFFMGIACSTKKSSAYSVVPDGGAYATEFGIMHSFFKKSAAFRWAIFQSFVEPFAGDFTCDRVVLGELVFEPLGGRVSGTEGWVGGFAEDRFHGGKDAKHLVTGVGALGLRRAGLMRE